MRLRPPFAAAALFALAACQKSDEAKVNKAGNDLNAAGGATAAAAKDLGAAVVHDADTATAKAADATGTALQKAGADIKKSDHKN
ncbi:MAG: hypothetical protein JOZ27_02975 [Caulobacteraceae bacterium]|nr:hypothetical protein [Caulobacteraceae bacterium]